MALALAAYGALFIPAVYFRVAFHVVKRYALMRDRVDAVSTSGTGFNLELALAGSVPYSSIKAFN